ncbi:hypothetical protein GLOIN_2v1581182 [Rhizophagus irregularis DAOM 181602=DAOM 197198]|uniref:Uncharacterized protein n=1 Tax=Rhizophagus irregularis (strain DAOM 181602 / DAOM 197198 / MUCL 43194) TaxID=747089 RepID=A0A2P4Q8K0_RHIID|nr:hypothetical protein GLOIN_2v1581182 [Rhizophagus irregularis DAOM 181602=DAOM 197198]POG73970.1 hypothetical protein GLOIN_2v1581182 [Rhizophagus irregularis DAOM 181602=DAOM 197198]|eukprot:XP_025180836.1 hypothetical protein GLOIN_2v1581182 [Rhizophagus irregularis DAOM 181602=DAOM 197198]
MHISLVLQFVLGHLHLTEFTLLCNLTASVTVTTLFGIFVNSAIEVNSVDSKQFPL